MTMQDTDTIQRFLFENTDIRGEIVRINHSYQTIMQQHAYPQVIANLLAESLISAILLSATLKFEGQLTLQFQSEGALKTLVAKCDNHHHIRGLAQFDVQVSLQNLSIQGGELVVTVQGDSMPTPYQSVIPLTHDSIPENLEVYFSQSVQLPTKVWIAVDDTAASGMILQLLPNQHGTMEERENFWEHAVRLGETITNDELLTLDNKTILRRLYNEDDIRLFDPEPIIFRCQCSQEKMKNVVLMLGQEETDDIFKQHQMLDITCEYCNKCYSYDRVDVAEIFANQNK